MFKRLNIKSQNSARREEYEFSCGNDTKKCDFSTKENNLFFVFTLIICAIFIFYQLIIYRRLTNQSASKDDGNLRLQNVVSQHSYFYCKTSQEKIDYNQVNDDYCDCLDGSDEPETNACSNGQFICAFQKPFQHYPKVILSSRVNDGICDCCDGSDEWKHKIVPHSLPGKQKMNII